MEYVSKNEHIFGMYYMPNKISSTYDNRANLKSVSIELRTNKFTKEIRLADNTEKFTELENRYNGKQSYTSLMPPISKIYGISDIKVYSLVYDKKTDISDKVKISINNLKKYVESNFKKYINIDTLYLNKLSPEEYKWMDCDFNIFNLEPDQNYIVEINLENGTKIQNGYYKNIDSSYEE